MATTELRCPVCGTSTCWREDTFERAAGQDCSTLFCEGKMEAVPAPVTRPMMLPSDSASRKEIPIVTGVLDYFPLAIAAVARLSKKGNDKHNPGQPLHWSREKSTDHADCIGKHLVDRGAIDPDSGMSHTVNIAWRALALLELEEEARLGKPMARGSEVSS